ncbi:MAG: DNA internalization-related competence protein ComEC/Rec2 [Lachnospiraceae bacterium]|nr:DNA internalization-related competence protein ComEC/Rec2 [Lachnospiraceae bacterium]
MRRPLMAVCLCLVLAAAMFLLGESPGRETWLDDAAGEMTLTGRVCRKNDNEFCLDSIKILRTAADLQQDIPITYNFIVTKPEKEDVLLGSRVTVTGVFYPFPQATNPGEFDAAAYYRSMGTLGRIQGTGIQQRSKDCWMVRETLYRLKTYWKNRLYHIFPKEEASVMSTMLLGEKTELDREIKTLYQRNGIVHILSISGLHITLIGMGIYRLLRRLGAPVWMAALAGGGILCLYGVMTGLGVSAVRAIGMYLLRMLAEVTGRTYDMMTAWGVMAAVMVLKNPLYLHNSGFLLSYASILGVGGLYPLLQQDAGNVWEKRIEGRKGEHFWRKAAMVLWDRLKQSLLAGFSITMMTLPIQLWFYYEIPVYSTLINLMVLPLMSLLMVTGLTAMLVPGLGVLGTVPCVILQWYENLCRFFDVLPGHTWTPGRPHIWQILLYYGVLLSVMGILKRRQVRALWIVLLTISVMIFGVRFRQGHSVTVLDVGQGDCICLQTKEGRVYLFDCGSSSREKVGQYVLKPFLKYHGISHIDGVFVSHPDEDHCNGIEELLQAGKEWGITVGNLMLCEGSCKTLAEDDTEGYGKLALAAKEGGCVAAVSGISAGDRWEVEGISFLCLHPEADDRAADNASSQCFYIDWGGGSLLLTGDVEGEGEQQFLERLEQYRIGNVTVLKVAHHGSKNSTSGALLAQIQPKVAVISCGRNNRYGHPHEDILERLEENGVTVLRTDESGAIEVKVKGDKVRILVRSGAEYSSE